MLVIEAIAISKMLDHFYDKAIIGIPLVSESVEELANDYFKKNSDIGKAVDMLIKNQVIKCGTSGFITGLGGAITLPFAIPTNLASVIYIQLRMIACIATLGGHDPKSDETRTLAFACLTGSAVADVVKKHGIKVGEKAALGLIKKIPGEVIKGVNRAFGFRFITKFGQTGIVNLGKILPLVGGVVGGGLDATTTKIIGNRAKKVFITGSV